MLAPSDVHDLLADVLHRHLGRYEGLSLAETVGPEGEPALDVLVKLDPAMAGLEHVDAQSLASTEIQWELGRKGDPRFAYVRYATEAELADLDA